jgi:outer membrane protein TolC
MAVLAFLVVAGGAGATAQAGNPSSAANPFFGSVTAGPASDATLKLSLDEAVGRGLKNNLGLKEAENGEKFLHGQKDEALQQFLPTITLSGDTGVYQHNLVTEGFGPDLISKLATLLGDRALLSGFSYVTRDDLTEGKVHYRQTLFSGPVIAGWKAAGAALNAASSDRMEAREEVVQQVTTAYLRAIAASSEVANAKALVAQGQVLLDHAQAAHQAGVAANLDELRAQVELQAQQQAQIAAENELAKDLILLKRETGIAPGQKIELTDPAPYSALATETPEEVRAVALRNRQDYRSLQNQVVEYKAIHTAYRSKRLPSLSFSSYYAESAVNGAGTRGNFVAMGTLTMPLFREASLRGDEDASRAQMEAVAAQLADLRGRIDEQVRAALLDVDATAKLVEVARSNVELATRALSDVSARVDAGVDDNLPLVTAQATLSSAESNLVESLYQYNVSKLELARAAGVVETQYRAYLGR